LEEAADHAAAAQAYETAYHCDPDNAEALLQYALSHAHTLEQEAIAGFLAQAFESSPEQHEPMLARLGQAAAAYAHIGMHELAAYLYQRAAALDGNNEEFLLLASQALLHSSAPEKAEPVLVSLLNGPKNAEAAALLDRVFSATGAVQKRVASWAALAAAHPANESVAHYHRIALGDMGMSLLDSGDHAAAYAALKDACAPACPQALFDLGLLMADLILHPAQERIPELQNVLRKQPELTPLAVSLLTRAVESMNQTGRHDEAQMLAHAAAALAPDSGTGQLQLGIAEEAVGNPAGAKAYYRQAVERAAAADEIAGAVDERLRNLCTTEERREFWQELAGAFPDKPSVQLHLAIALEQEGRYAEALLHFEGIGEAYSERADFQAHYGGTLAATGSLDTGMERLNKALALAVAWAPLIADIAVRAGDACLARNEAESAQRLYRFALDSHPAHLLAGLKLGRTLAASGNPVAAGAAYREVIIRVPDAPAAREAAREWDAALKAQGDPAARAAAWREMAAALPDAPFLLEYCLPALAASGAVTEALGLCESALSRHADNEALRLAHAALLYLAGRREEGERRLATELSPAASGMLELAVEASRAALEQGDGAAAEQMLRRLLSVQGENLLCQALLGESLAAQGRHEEALSWYRQVLAAAPESPHTAALLDASCGKLGNPDACVQLWEELVKIHPESPVLNQHLNSRRTRE
jgi:tetratricopeptide (TPR) repeat protein